MAPTPAAPKLMAFDLDGTLLFDGRVSPEDSAAIRRWQEAGNLAVCSTGKSLSAARAALEGSGIDFDYSVLYTGGAVVDAQDRILMSRTLPNELVQEIVATATDTSGIMVYATTLDTPDAVFPSTVKGKSSPILAHFEPMAVEDIPEHEFVGIPLWIDGDEQLLQDTMLWLQEDYGEVLGIHRNQDFIDIVPPHCTKGSGLEWLDEQKLGGKYETYSLGDSWNDLAMHAWARHSASFEHSPQEVKDATDDVVSSAAQYIDQVLAGDDAGASRG